MSRHTGHIELDRTVESIIVGNRHRTDLGDLTALAESIARDGLLQPLTVTIDGVLVCGARRLAAIKLLGWRTVNVWVRSGITGRLGHLLAEQDDNMLHKDLTPVEAAALYRELKTLMAEDASRRQAATRFSAENQPGKDGAGKFPAPSFPVGRASEQAAAMIPGGASYKTLDKIDYLRQVTDDPDLPATGVRCSWCSPTSEPRTRPSGTPTTNCGRNSSRAGCRPSPSGTCTKPRPTWTKPGYSLPRVPGTSRC